MLMDGRTDDGRKVITIAHPEQSSGELKIKSKGRCICLSLNIINIDACTCVNFGYVQCSKGNNSKSRQNTVTVHVFCKWSHSALHL